MNKKAVASILLGAIIGGTVGTIKDVVEDNKNPKMTAKNIIFGAGIGAILGLNIATYISVKDMKSEIVKDAKESIVKEAKQQIDFKNLQTNVENEMNVAVDNVIDKMNKRAEDKINKTIKAINKQNILDLEEKTNNRLDKMSETISRLDERTKNNPSIIWTTSGRKVDETNKNDLILEAINSGNYTAYELNRIIESIGKL